jgi:hypothetical protein
VNRQAEAGACSRHCITIGPSIFFGSPASPGTRPGGLAGAALLRLYKALSYSLTLFSLLLEQSSDLSAPPSPTGGLCGLCGLCVPVRACACLCVLVCASAWPPLPAGPAHGRCRGASQPPGVVEILKITLISQAVNSTNRSS